MEYNFDEAIERRHTQSSKWDNVGVRVGNSEALPMWVADTDFTCPAPVVEAVVEHARHPIYGYSFIVPEFYDATIRWIKRQHGWEIRRDWIVFATGIVPVMNTMVQEYTDEGDEIIIQQPVYHPFGFAIDDNKRVLSNNQLIYRNGQYTVDLEDLERRAASADICVRNHVLMVVDEIHSDLIFTGHRHVPLASLKPEYAMNSVTCYAPSKTFNCAGLRCSGLVIPNPKIKARLERLIPYLEENVKYLDTFLKENMPEIKLVKPEGTYLMWLDCSELGFTPDKLADFFSNKALVAISRGDGFGVCGGQFVRMNIGCPRKTLKKGLERIRKALCSEERGGAHEEVL